jgi:hypothetical protein
LSGNRKFRQPLKNSNNAEFFKKSAFFEELFENPVDVQTSPIYRRLAAAFLLIVNLSVTDIIELFNNFSY